MTFPWKNGNSHLTLRSAENIFAYTLRSAVATKHIFIQCLRHSLIIYLSEIGTYFRKTIVLGSQVARRQKYISTPAIII